MLDDAAAPPEAAVPPEAGVPAEAATPAACEAVVPVLACERAVDALPEAPPGGPSVMLTTELGVFVRAAYGTCAQAASARSARSNSPERVHRKASVVKSAPSRGDFVNTLASRALELFERHPAGAIFRRRTYVFMSPYLPGNFTVLLLFCDDLSEL
ncbi:MAG: hypothetical protein ACRETB_06400 [Steroidobacteraceae bacterium]